MSIRDAVEVARRCLCLELLLQRLGLETDADDPVADRDEVRRRWLARLADLELEQAVLAPERALLEAPVGSLSEDDLDDLDGRASGALVLLWGLGRLEARPTFATLEDMDALLADRGLLGAGSISRAKEAVASASLRAERDLHDGLAAYGRTRGKARETDDPEKIFAGVGAHHVAWILDHTLPAE